MVDEAVEQVELEVTESGAVESTDGRGIGPEETSGRAALARLDHDRLQRFLLGFLLAAAFFFVEAGVAEIMLARNAECVETLSRIRLAPNPWEYCMSEFGYYLAGSASRAVFDAVAPQLLVWSLLGLGYGLIGGAFAQLKLRQAVAGYLILHLLLLAGFAALGYLSQFIV